LRRTPIITSAHRVFVGAYGGRIFVFDDVSDPSPTLFAGLSPQV